LFATVFRDGLADGRRASCQAVARFHNAKADALIRAALDDPDAGVQAAAIRQMRTRKIPDALQRLVRLLDAPAAEVRDAARTSLAEFNFIRYKAMFDLLDSEAARTTGRLVHKVDDTAIQRLQEELNSPAITARLRAIEMAIAMAATDDVEPILIDLTQHDNIALRKEAILALGHNRRAESIRTLERASLDPNGTIAEAARTSLTLAMKGRTVDSRHGKGGQR
jgi:HEAT repeat protein